MQNIFKYISKVLRCIALDNLSTTVAHMGKGHDRTLTDGFNRFMPHYGFETDFCNGVAGWEKGNVENKVGYERRNMFVPVATIPDFNTFNKKLFKACDKEKRFTGSSEEVEEALEACKRQNNEKVILLECCSQYPTQYEDMNIFVISNMKQCFGKIVG